MTGYKTRAKRYETAKEAVAAIPGGHRSLFLWVCQVHPGGEEEAGVDRPGFYVFRTDMARLLPRRYCLVDAGNKRPKEKREP